jgi:hypothetical protein
VPAQKRGRDPADVGAPASPCPAPDAAVAATAAEILKGLQRPSTLVSAPTLPWLWHGYLARGKVTLLTSQWKSGKTTLVSVLLARLQEGGQLAGLPVAAGRAIVVSEEGIDNWNLRCRRLGLGDHIGFLCRPFRGKPTWEQWLALVDALAQLHARNSLALAVIDSLTAFLPGRNENTAALMMEALMPLQRLLDAGVSLLLVHHPRKGNILRGQAARGSGALASFVDVLIEMTWLTQPGDGNRRRRLRSFSRHDQTPSHLVVELSADGTDYLAHGDIDDEELNEDFQGLNHVLEDAVTKLTRVEILEQWPDDYPVPERTTLWRWLDQAAKRGVLRQDGSGSKSDPFRYWLPGREPMLRPDRGASAEEMEAWNQRLMQAFCGEPKAV